jgi:archaellum component FlaC
MSDNMKGGSATQGKSVQEIINELDRLADEVRGVHKEIDEVNKVSSKAMDEISARADETIKEIEHTESELKEAEHQAGEELDALALKESEDLGSEE